MLKPWPSYLLHLNVFSVANGTSTLDTSSCPPTPDIMEVDQSNDEARTSEPITESPPQEYALPDQQDDLKLGSSVANQEHLDGEPDEQDGLRLESTVLNQEHLDGEPNEQDGLKLDSTVSNQEHLDGEPTSNSPAQERFVPSNQEGQKSSAVTIVDRIINLGQDQTAVPLSRRATFRPVIIVSEEVSGQEPKEQSPAVGRARIQQPQLGGVQGSLAYGWQESNVAQPSGASAGESSSLNDQRRTEVQVSDPSSHLKAGSPALGREPQGNAPGSRFDTLFQGGRVLPPLHMTQRPLPKLPGPNQNQEEQPFRLPLIAELDRPSKHTRWDSQRKHGWRGYVPDVYESRRLEEQTADGQPRQLVEGATQPLGPPMKPFDSKTAEAVAQEQCRRLQRDTEIRENSRT